MTSHARVLTALDGEQFSFDAGRFCLELLMSGGPGPYDVYEQLHEPADLVAWLADSRLAQLAPLDDVRVRPAELRDIKGFRDALWSAASSAAHGDRPAPADLAAINDAVAAPPLPHIGADLTRRWVTPVTGTQVLGAAAAEAIELLTTDEPSRLRECAAERCPLLFYDTSRPGTRRWCSMQRCGNRHKVRTHRTKPRRMQ